MAWFAGSEGYGNKMDDFMEKRTNEFRKPYPKGTGIGAEGIDNCRRL